MMFLHLFSFLLIYFHFIIGKAMSNLMVFLLGCAPELAMELFKNRHAWTSPPGHFNLIGLDCGRGIYVFKKLPGGSEAKTSLRMIVLIAFFV